MKRQVLYLGVAIALACFLISQPTGVTAAQGPRIQAEAGSDGPAASEIPPAKQKEWEGVKRALFKEYEVCLEHCGNREECESKCRKAYESRLEQERSRITGKAR